MAPIVSQGVARPPLNRNGYKKQNNKKQNKKTKTNEKDLSIRRDNMSNH